MHFRQLVSYVKADGCKVRLYNKPELKLALCTGTFDISKNGNPIICLAKEGHTHTELKQLLLHEYAHFLQWKSGLLGILEGEDLYGGWDVIDRFVVEKKDHWRNGNKYTKEDFIKARNAVILIEYDAEIRTLELSKELNIDIGSHREYMCSALSYVSFLKWCMKYKRWDAHTDSSYFNQKLKTPTEILEPLDWQDEMIIRKLIE